MVISDEIYAELTYEGTHVSIARPFPACGSGTITLNGFSKAFAMTGWRMGFACAPDATSMAVDVQDSPVHYALRAHRRASTRRWRRSSRRRRQRLRRRAAAWCESYDRRRRLIVHGAARGGAFLLRAAGRVLRLPRRRPNGHGFSDAFCEKLLCEQKVAAVPGTAFGQGGEGHIRLSYATSLDKIEEAVKRMGRFLEKQGK